MNIFVLDNCPIESAKQLCNKHIVKMGLEAAQMLSVALHENGIAGPIKPAYVNHPCTIWARSSKQNFVWLVTHMQAIFEEYTNRYGKIHKLEMLDYAKMFLDLMPELPDIGLTPHPQCMPEEYKVENNPVKAYRNYYIGEKAKFAKWPDGSVPLWFSSVVHC